MLLVYIDLMGDNESIPKLAKLVLDKFSADNSHLWITALKGHTIISGYVWLQEDNNIDELEQSLQEFSGCRGTVQIFRADEMKQYSFERRQYWMHWRFVE